MSISSHKSGDGRKGERQRRGRRGWQTSAFLLIFLFCSPLAARRSLKLKTETHLTVRTTCKLNNPNHNNAPSNDIIRFKMPNILGWAKEAEIRRALFCFTAEEKNEAKEFGV